MPESASRGGWGGCLLQGGVCSGEGWCLLWGCLLRRVSALGGCLVPGGYPSMHRGRHPPREQNDKQVQKYYLGHNFVAAGNNVNILTTFSFSLVVLDEEFLFSSSPFLSLVYLLYYALYLQFRHQHHPLCRMMDHLHLYYCHPLPTVPT